MFGGKRRASSRGKLSRDDSQANCRKELTRSSVHTGQTKENKKLKKREELGLLCARTGALNCTQLNPEPSSSDRRKCKKLEPGHTKEKSRNYVGYLTIRKKQSSDLTTLLNKL